MPQPNVNQVHHAPSERIPTSSQEPYVPKMREQLGQYARKLIDAGFEVWAPQERMRRWVTYFHYARMVGEQKCWGYVQEGEFPRLGHPLEHSMPIQPSRDWGSFLLVRVPHGSHTVQAAEHIARPVNFSAISPGKAFANHKPRCTDVHGSSVRVTEIEIVEDIR